jgi:hypothetical protein
LTIGTEVLPLYSSVNESFEPPWFVSSTEAKQPPQLRLTSWKLGTSVPAEAPP